jgi:acetyl/propionyl-CoA carboxylase alpha subunit
MVTGLDLVALQLDIAEGARLPMTQEEIRIDGWAMEARLYAEDPSADFMPHSGRIAVWRTPAAARVDSGVAEGDSFTTFYDPMVAKIIAHGDTRDEARMKLVAALQDTVMLGVGNNRDFLLELLLDEAFANGGAGTDYIEANIEKLTMRRPPGGDAALALLAATMVDRQFGDLLTGWNSRGASTFPLQVARGNGEIVRADATVTRDGVSVRRGDAVSGIAVIAKSGDELRYEADGRAGRAFYARNIRTIDIDDAGAAARYFDFSLAPAEASGAGADAAMAPMAGVVTSISVKPGDRVTKGQTLATIEAMKMEHQLKAPRDGVVAELLAKTGDQVAIRARIVTLEPEG